MENKKPIGLLIDNGTDIPKDFVADNQIEVVEHDFYIPGEENNKDYQNNPQIFYQKMKENKALPKTSFASVGKFYQAYQKALERFENVLAIILTSKHSGAFNAACQAKRMLGETSSKVEVLDSLLVSAPQGILVMKAQELVNLGKKIKEILENMTQFRKKIKTIAFLDDLSWAVAGGRISGNLAKIMTFFQKKGIRVALTIKEGKLTLGSIKVSAKDRVEAIVRELKGKAGKVKVAIAHANIPQETQRLKEEIEKIGKEVLYVAEMTLVLASHGGPGTLVVSYYEE